MTRGLLAAGCTSRIDGTGVALGEPWTGAEGLALGPDAPGHQAPCSRGAHFTRRKSPFSDWCVLRGTPFGRYGAAHAPQNTRRKHGTLAQAAQRSHPSPT